MLFIIGLGLNSRGISRQGLEILRRCKKVYLENYTVDFPYSEIELADILGKKIISVDRAFVEGLSFVDEAAKKDVALLVYGSPLTATTHIAIVQECRASKIRYKIVYSASILDAVAETGLQIYKFGKIASMPAWNSSENYEPDSFMEIVKDNQKIKAHSLILIDIGLSVKDALDQLKKSSAKYKIKLDKIILCQAMGTKNSKIFYKPVSELREFIRIRKPYCLIIPSDLHFLEKEFLENMR